MATQDYTLKTEHGFHSNKFEYNVLSKNGKSQLDWEKELGIDSIRVSLREHGWETWQWNVHTQKEIDECEFNTHFVEAFSPYYHGYLRGDSRVSLRDACEKILNISQRFNDCERKTGHLFEPKEEYSNGLLSCKYCGFWGYSNLFHGLKDEVENYKICVDVEKENAFEVRQAIRKIGLASNLCGGLLIKNLGDDLYTRCDGEFNLSEEFLVDLWGLFRRYGVIKK